MMWVEKKEGRCEFEKKEKKEGCLRWWRWWGGRGRRGIYSAYNIIYTLTVSPKGTWEGEKKRVKFEKKKKDNIFIYIDRIIINHHQGY